MFVFTSSCIDVRRLNQRQPPPPAPPVQPATPPIPLPPVQPVPLAQPAGLTEAQVEAIVRRVMAMEFAAMVEAEVRRAMATNIATLVEIEVRRVLDTLLPAYGQPASVSSSPPIPLPTHTPVLPMSVPVLPMSVPVSQEFVQSVIAPSMSSVPLCSSPASPASVSQYIPPMCASGVSSSVPLCSSTPAPPAQYFSPMCTSVSGPPTCASVCHSSLPSSSLHPAPVSSPFRTRDRINRTPPHLRGVNLGAPVLEEARSPQPSVPEVDVVNASRLLQGPAAGEMGVVPVLVEDLQRPSQEGKAMSSSDDEESPQGVSSEEEYARQHGGHFHSRPRLPRTPRAAAEGGSPRGKRRAADQTMPLKKSRMS